MDKRGVAVAGVLGVLVLGVLVWLTAPDTGAPVEERARQAVEVERVAPAPTVQPRAAPAPVAVPITSAREGLEAIAEIHQVYTVRCEPPDEPDLQAPFGPRVAEDGSFVTVVSKPSGRMPVTRARVKPGAKTAGHYVWEGAVLGEETPCRFVPAEPVTVTVEVVGLDGHVRINACRGNVLAEVVDGSATFEVPQGELCALKVQEDVSDRPGEDSWRRVMTENGYMTMIRPEADQTLQIVVVDEQALSSDELSAYHDAGNDRADELMTIASQAQLDLERVLQEADLSSEARSWVMQHMR